jgi:hypothetical protein
MAHACRSIRRLSSTLAFGLITRIRTCIAPVGLGYTAGLGSAAGCKRSVGDPTPVALWSVCTGRGRQFWPS